MHRTEFVPSWYQCQYFTGLRRSAVRVMDTRKTDCGHEGSAQQHLIAAEGLANLKGTDRLCQSRLTGNIRQSCAALEASAIARCIDDESRTPLSICTASHQCLGQNATCYVKPCNSCSLEHMQRHICDFCYNTQCGASLSPMCPRTCCACVLLRW